jgi:NADH:ubiquinone oxidoreductase subunit D
VVSLTYKALDPAAVKILSKGLNYAHTTSLKNNLKDVISRVEQAIQHLPTETAEEIQQERSRILRQSECQKKNTSKAEHEVLQALWVDREITVLPADKGNTAVILLSKDYDNKIRAILSNPLYTKLTADPTSKTER